MNQYYRNRDAYNAATQVAITTTVPKLEKVTEKYTFLSTAQLIADVEAQGYTVTRIAGPKKGSGFGKHVVQFSHPSFPKLNGRTMNLLVYNSHDGSSSWQARFGFTELVCCNGLVVGNPLFSARITHVGYAADKVKAALEAMLGQAPQVVNIVQKMQSTLPTAEQAAAFLIEASKLRDAKPFAIASLNKVRHAEQSENTAWNTFNRVQEALIKGGYRTEDASNGITIPGKLAREVKAVKAQQDLNIKLWNLAEKHLLTA